MQSLIIFIGSDNGLTPGRRRAIIWTNPGISLVEPLGKKLQWNLNRNSYIFIQENALENVVRKMSAILSRPQCVNTVATGSEIVIAEAAEQVIWFWIKRLSAYRHTKPSNRLTNIAIHVFWSQWYLDSRDLSVAHETYIIASIHEEGSGLHAR